MRSKRLTSSSAIGAMLIALALLTTTSTPPRRSTVASTARWTASALPNVADDRQRLAARRADRLGRGVDRARQPRVRRVGLGDQRDVGAVLRKLHGDRLADPAAAAAHEDGPAVERADRHAAGR
jgi:hypothetical protein